MKLRKIYIIILLWITILLPTQLLAQQTFQKAFYQTASDNFNVKKILATNDGGAMVIVRVGGEKFDGVSILMKLNKDYEPEWTKNVLGGFEQACTINDIIQISDGTYVITGSLHQMGDDQFFIYAIDGKGERRWGSMSGIPGKSEEGGVLKYHKNRVYVAGNTGSFSALPNEYFVAAFDTFGNQIDEGAWMLPSTDLRVVDMQITPEDDIFLAANIKDGPSSDPALIRINNDFTHDYEQRIVIAGLNVATNLFLIGDKLVLTGTDNNTLSGRFFATIIPAYTPTLAYKSIFFDFGEDVNLYDVKQNQTSGLIFSGEINGTSRSCLNMRANFDGIADDFNIQWAVQYGDEEEQGFTSIDVNKNNFIISAGNSLGYVPGAYSVYICKAFSTGFTGCREEALTVVKSTEIDSYNENGGITGAGIFAASVSLILPLSDRSFNFQNACDEAPPNSDFGFFNPFCEDTCITFTNNSSFGDTFFWTFEGGTPATYNGLTPPDICFNTGGTFNITLIATNDLGADTTTKPITVHPKPVIKAPNDTTICAGSTFWLKGEGGLSYEWSGYSDEDDILTDDNIIPAHTNTYFVKGMGVGGCEGFDTLNLTVIQPPVEVGFDTLICDDSSINLSAGNNGFSYLWSTGSTQQRITVNETNIYTVNVSNSCFNIPYTFKVETENCAPTFYVPNALSPNGNGVNDSFYIIGKNITVTRLEIFSRWGELVFEGNESNGYIWDGTYKGDPVPDGLYIYQATIRPRKGKLQYLKGIIVVIK